MHFERRNAFQNSLNYFFPEKILKKTICLPTLPKIFRPVTQNTFFMSDCRSRGREFDARSHTFVKIDHEIISTVILLPSADSFKKGCCQLQAKVCAQITG